MDKASISPKALDNITKLAIYLKDLAMKGGFTNSVGFDMDFYSRKSHNNECGSTACAVGHFALMIGGKIHYNGVYMAHYDGAYMVDDNLMSWLDFSKEHLDINPCGTKESMIIWDWLFNGAWSDIDNTALGVVARIEHFLDSGIPHDFISESSDKYNYMMVNEYLERRVDLESDTELARSTHA